MSWRQTAPASRLMKTPRIWANGWFSRPGWKPIGPQSSRRFPRCHSKRAAHAEVTLSFLHVYRPPAAPGAPTLLMLHGTGGNEHDLLPMASELLPGAGVLSPRGKVLERGMPRFFRRLSEGVFDIEDLKQRTAELADFVAEASEHYRFDASRIIAVGFSNGANIAASLLLLKPGVLKRAVLFRAMVPLVPDPLPSGDVELGAHFQWPRRSARARRGNGQARRAPARGRR